MYINQNARIRFNSRYQLDPQTGCWNWQGAKRTTAGYGAFSYKDQDYLAHRFSLMMQGQVIENALVCHHCDNPSCVNPDHLYLGTAKTNTLDKITRNRAQWQIPNYTSPNRKLDAAAIHNIRAWTQIGRGGNVDEIARQFNIARSAILNIVARRTYREI